MLLHDGQELDDDLGAGSDEDLALAGLLGVVDGVERIVQNTSLDHFGGIEELRFSNRKRICFGDEVSNAETPNSLLSSLGLSLLSCKTAKTRLGQGERR